MMPTIVYHTNIASFRWVKFSLSGLERVFSLSGLESVVCPEHVIIVTYCVDFCGVIFCFGLRNETKTQQNFPAIYCIIR